MYDLKYWKFQDSAVYDKKRTCFRVLHISCIHRKHNQIVYCWLVSHPVRLSLLYLISHKCVLLNVERVGLPSNHRWGKWVVKFSFVSDVQSESDKNLQSSNFLFISFFFFLTWNLLPVDFLAFMKCALHVLQSYMIFFLLKILLFKSDVYTDVV